MYFKYIITGRREIYKLESEVQQKNVDTQKI